jgi:AcrR family transcriptional regulator
VKEEILTASVDLFMQYGIRSVTMDDIARHLSISKKTIYQFFKDKEEIIMLATKAHIEKEERDFKEIDRSSSNAIEHLHKISLCMRERIRNLNPSLLYDLQKYYKKAWAVYQDFKDKVIYESLIKLLNQGKNEGFFRENINPGILAILRIEEIQMSFNNEVFSNDKYDLKEIHEQLFDHFMYGILTPNGLKLIKEYQHKTTIDE